MSDFDDVNHNLLSVALYKKLQKQLEPIVEKIDALESASSLVEAVAGPKGERGARGETGSRGEIGPQGLRGETGPRGEKGDVGEHGIQGDVGPIGPQGDVGPIGPQGDVGPRGEKGDVGEHGIQGDVGPRGEKGDVGEHGIQGDVGPIGPVGEKGDKGDTGDRGEVGPMGLQGEQGDRGEAGPMGSQGDRGEVGLQGPVGEKGDKGDTGDRGEVGPMGLQGEQGDRGEVGPQGERGETGPVGPVGPEGLAGKDAILPDIDAIIDPFIERVQTNVDSYIDKSEKTFKGWQSMVNTQLSTIGGGGEVWLGRLNDVDRTSAKVDGAYLKYDAATKKWIGADAASSSALSAHISDATVHLTSTQNTLLDGITVTAEKVNYLSDVASNIQDQLDAKQPLDSDLTAIAALTGTSGLLRKTGTDTWTLDTNEAVVDPVRTTVLGNGVLSTFAINGASGLINPSALIVAIDGILQEPIVDYTVSGGNITFTSPLPSGSKAVVISPTNSLQVSQNIPADGSVTSAKLDNSINFATRPTTSDTGTLVPTSLITRSDVDARSVSSVLGTNFTVNNSATRADTTMVLSLGVGTWELNGFFQTLNAATGGAKIYIAIVGAQPESYQHRLTMISVNGGSTNPLFTSGAPAYGSGTTPFVFNRSVASGSVSQFQLLPSVIVLTAPATFTIGFSQDTAVASETILYSFSRFWANRISH
jgi:hypothetical protein